MFAGELPIVKKRLFLGLFSEPAEVLRIRISGNLVPTGLSAAERVIGEQTAGMDHFNDASSIVLPRYPLPLQKLRTDL